jgi:hypothetical protein
MMDSKIRDGSEDKSSRERVSPRRKDEALTLKKRKDSKESTGDDIASI